MRILAKDLPDGNALYLRLKLRSFTTHLDNHTLVPHASDLCFR